jgi:hypothetical protein
MNNRKNVDLWLALFASTACHSEYLLSAGRISFMRNLSLRAQRPLLGEAISLQ